MEDNGIRRPVAATKEYRIRVISNGYKFRFEAPLKSVARKMFWEEHPEYKNEKIEILPSHRTWDFNWTPDMWVTDD